MAPEPNATLQNSTGSENTEAIQIRLKQDVDIPDLGYALPKDSQHCAIPYGRKSVLVVVGRAGSIQRLVVLDSEYTKIKKQSIKGAQH